MTVGVFEMTTIRRFAVLAAVALAVPGTPAFAADAMRVDYYHTGNDREERFSLDRIVIEPLPFPGNPSRPSRQPSRNSLRYPLGKDVRQCFGRTLIGQGAPV